MPNRVDPSIDVGSVRGADRRDRDEEPVSPAEEGRRVIEAYAADLREIAAKLRSRFLH